MKATEIKRLDTTCPDCGAKDWVKHSMMKKDELFFLECNNADCCHRGPQCKTEGRALLAWDRELTHIKKARREARESYESRKKK